MPAKNIVEATKEGNTQETMILFVLGGTMQKSELLTLEYRLNQLIKKVGELTLETVGSNGDMPKAYNKALSEANKALHAAKREARKIVTDKSRV